MTAEDFDPRKNAGTMCYVWDCTVTEVTEPPLHGITRKCANGHRVTLRYCERHFGYMMGLALRKPGPQPDGLYLGIPLCKECHAPLALVLEETGA